MKCVSQSGICMKGKYKTSANQLDCPAINELTGRASHLRLESKIQSARQNSTNERKIHQTIV